MSEANRERWVIGIDVGGTKVAGGLVDHHGGIGRFLRSPMNPRGTAAEGFAAVTGILDKLLGEFAGAQPETGKNVAIGVCAPGPLDPRTGVVLNPPNVPCWRDFPLVAEVERRYGCAARLDNDANAAALAESLWGAGRGQ